MTSTARQSADVDGVDVSGLRAQVAAAVGGVSVLAMVLLAAVNPPSLPARTHWISTVVVAGAYLLLGGWSWARGRRFSDSEAFLAVIVALAANVVLIACDQQRGSPVSLEQCLLCPALLAAVFCSRRWQVAVAFVLTAMGVAYLVFARLGFGAATGAALAVEVNTDLIVLVVVRVMREVMFAAAGRAVCGEVTDPLTGLANRRGLERRGSMRWADVADRNSVLTLLVVDIDHFKRVNDTFGHAAGDDVIRRVANILRVILREGDVAVRLGGEEFLVLAQMPSEQAVPVAERLRATIAKDLYPVTVSIGVHWVTPASSDELPASLWREIDLADQALYGAKRSGRNRVVTTSDLVRAAAPAVAQRPAAQAGDGSAERAASARTMVPEPDGEPR